MQVRTSILIKSTTEALWPLLTHSRMEVPGFFCLGLPRPVSCELPDQSGGVGAERRCISDRGVVVQKITQWSPPQRLRFEMASTDHKWRSQVDSITEDFRLQPHPNGVILTRTTMIQARLPFRRLKEAGFYLGLKRVHLYVFKNWQRQLEKKVAPA